jgi:hypothetical protein
MPMDDIIIIIVYKNEIYIICNMLTVNRNNNTSFYETFHIKFEIGQESKIILD